MITAEWCVCYTKNEVRKETNIVLTGKTWDDIRPIFISTLNTFGNVISSDFVSCKEEKESSVE